MLGADPAVNSTSGDTFSRVALKSVMGGNLRSCGGGGKILPKFAGSISGRSNFGAGFKGSFCCWERESGGMANAQTAIAAREIFLKELAGMNLDMMIASEVFQRFLGLSLNT